MLHLGNNTRDVLKIKEVFPNLQVEKIKNIQKFIKCNGKSKPKLIMTTKGPSRKQVIVSINNDNKTSFMKDSSNYATNLNRAFMGPTNYPSRKKHQVGYYGQLYSSRVIRDYYCHKQSCLTSKSPDY